MPALTSESSKRKASEDAASPDSQKQIKKARTDSPEREPKVCLYFELISVALLTVFVVDRR
jgi:hypothetical protein